MQVDLTDVLLAPQAHMRSYQFDRPAAELVAIHILDPHVKQADKE